MLLRYTYFTLKASCQIICKIKQVVASKHNFVVTLSLCSILPLSDVQQYTFLSFYRHVDSVIQSGPRCVSFRLHRLLSSVVDLIIKIMYSGWQKVCHDDHAPVHHSVFT